MSMELRNRIYFSPYVSVNNSEQGLQQLKAIKLIEYHIFRVMDL